MNQHIKVMNNFENKLIYILPSDSIGEKFLYELQINKDIL